MRRTLAPEEAALWKRVIATVTPLKRVDTKPLPPAAASPAEPAPVKAPTGARAVPTGPKIARPPSVQLAPARAEVRVRSSLQKREEDGLDGGWDRRLARGLVAPESSIDLHGHTLSTAYDRLDHGLDQAIRQGDRVLLLITGKPPRAESERPHARGAIRAAIGDWLAASRHADRIAAVRTAHPRHGGSGALYVVLRRPRATAPRKS